ncbi:MAG: FHA domain-containing protein [Verrucomicrobiota bacterium]
MEKETGALKVQRKSVPDKGCIYFINGKITSASTKSLKNRVAALAMLAWKSDDIDASWEKDLKINEITCDLAPDEVLVEFMSLESKFPDPDLLLSQIQQMSAVNRQTKEKDKRRETIVLPDFKKYVLYLEAENCNLENHRFELEEGSQIVGCTDEFAQIVIPHDSISRRHCSITVTQESVELIDMGSTNGTFIRDEMIEDAFIVPSDVIYVGGVKLRLNATLKPEARSSAIPIQPKNPPAMTGENESDEPLKPTIPLPGDSRPVPTAEKPVVVHKPAPRKAPEKGTLRDTAKLNQPRPTDEATKAVHWKDVIKKEKQRQSVRGVNAFNWRLHKKK